MGHQYNTFYEKNRKVFKKPSRKEPGAWLHTMNKHIQSCEDVEELGQVRVRWREFVRESGIISACLHQDYGVSDYDFMNIV